MITHGLPPEALLISASLGPSQALTGLSGSWGQPSVRVLMLLCNVARHVLANLWNAGGRPLQSFGRQGQKAQLWEDLRELSNPALPCSHQPDHRCNERLFLIPAAAPLQGNAI